MNNLIITDSTYMKIDKLRSLDLSKSDIAKACGLSEDEVNWIIANDSEYAKIYAKRIDSKANQLLETNNSWDSVEHEALQQINEHFKTMKEADMVDEDFALKVASLANRAQRRNGADVTAPKQMTAKITVNNNFKKVVQEFYSNDGGYKPPTIDQEPKVRNQCDAQKVRSLEYA